MNGAVNANEFVTDPPYTPTHEKKKYTCDISAPSYYFSPFEKRKS